MEQGVRLERAGGVEVQTTTSEIAIKRAKAKARIRRCPLRGRYGGQVRGLDVRRLSGEPGCPEERVEATVRRAKVEKEKTEKVPEDYVFRLQTSLFKTIALSNLAKDLQK